MVTTIPMAVRNGTVGTAFSATAATTLSVATVNNTGQMNCLLVMAVAIYSSSVTVSTVTGGGILGGWTFQGGQTNTATGVRVEMWTAPAMAYMGAGTTTVTFSGSVLASLAVSLYTEPYDYNSYPLVGAGTYTNTSGVTTGVHNETFTLSGFAITAGNLMIVTVDQTGNFLGGGMITSVTDSIGTTYTAINAAGAGTGNIRMDVFAGLAGASAAAYPGVTVTVHWNQNSAVQRYIWSAYSGATATVDATASGGAQSGGTLTTNIVTTNANDLIHAVSGWYGGQLPAQGQYPGYGYNNGNNEGARVVTSAGTYPTYWQVTNTNGICIQAFKMSPTYTPTAPPTPRTATATGPAASGYYAEVDLTPQTGGNMIVTAFAVATSSGDTFANQRNSVTPTLTSAAAVIMDAGPENVLATMRTQLRMSAQRGWAAFSFELVAGNTSAAPTSNVPIRSGSNVQVFNSKYQVQSEKAPVNFKVPVAHSVLGGASLALFAQALASATLGIPYTETVFVNGGTSPYVLSVLSGSLPPGMSLSSSGVISGTPTATGTYNFTIKVVDSLLNTATGSFQIMTLASTNSGFVN
jgi:hypothetical protein